MTTSRLTSFDHFDKFFSESSKNSLNSLTFINNNTYRTRSLQSNNFYFRMQFYSSRSTYATSSESSVCIFNEGDRCKKESNLKIRVNKKKIKICKNIFKNITMKKKRKWWMRSTKKIHKRIFISSHFLRFHIEPYGGLKMPKTKKISLSVRWWYSHNSQFICTSENVMNWVTWQHC